MKKILVALAVASAVGSASAADVSLYGVIDTGLTYRHTQGEDSLEMNSGNYAGPRFGLRGTEDLGEGVKVGFILESGYKSDTGAMAKEDTLFNRESQVYLQGDWGTFGVGRVAGFSSGSSSLSWYWDLEPFETAYNDAGTQGSMIDVWALHSNTLYYYTPTVAGFKAGLQYSMSGEDDLEAQDWEDRDQWFNAAVRWDGATVHALAALEVTSWKNAALGQVDRNNTYVAKLAAAWDVVPNVRLYAGASAFQDAREFSESAWDDTPVFDTKSDEGLDGYSFNLGARYTVGQADFLGQVQYLAGENNAAVAGAEEDFSRYIGSVGIHYHFSNRTMAYAVASYANGKDLINTEQTYAHVGLTHYF